jgi:hypothetical protein
LEAAGEVHPDWHKVPCGGALLWEPIHGKRAGNSYPDLVAWFRITHPEETAAIEARILAQQNLSG